MTESTPTHGDNARVHRIVDGRFVCTAAPSAPCRNYPGCECEQWSLELHGDPPAPGHEEAPQEHCWATPWIEATGLEDCFEGDDPADGWPEDGSFPDGPVSLSWEGEFLTWDYAKVEQGASR